MSAPDGAGAESVRPPEGHSTGATSGYAEHRSPGSDPPESSGTGSAGAACPEPGSPGSESTGPDVPAAPAPPSVSTVNVANLLTLSRLVLVPVFLFALFTESGQSVGWRLAAAALFAVASITDQVDGWIARRYGLITDFGKLADPIADKALIGAALVGLSVLGELPWWVTAVIAVRELGVTVLRFWVIRHGVIPASRGGKAKTVAQVLAIALYLLPLADVADTARGFVMGIAVTLTVLTGLDYVIRAARLRGHARRQRG